MHWRAWIGALVPMALAACGGSGGGADDIDGSTVASADLAVSGVGPGVPIVRGDLALYKMTVANAGPGDARDVIIENSVGPQQTIAYIDCTAIAGAVCPVALGATMTVPEIPQYGQVTFTIAAQVAPAAADLVTNTLSARLANDPVSSNNVSTAIASTETAASLTGTVVNLQSDPGDYIGLGASYTYSQANSVIELTATGNHVNLRIDGDQLWRADFRLPDALTQVQVGTYAQLRRFPFHDPALGGLDWSGEGRGCNTLQGWLVVESAVYSGGVLVELDMRFEQHCGDEVPALRGHVRWRASDATRPSGPIDPAPAELWRPPAGATPNTGNYVYLQSDYGDTIGGGSSRTIYTQANAVLSISAADSVFRMSVTGDQWWTGEFAAMNTVARLQPGFYPNLRRWPFHNPARGGLSWAGDGRGCSTLTGWMVIDSVAYTGNALTQIDLRFEQHCEGLAPALRGQIHWVAGDPTAPPGPQSPPPAGLWQPRPGSTPVGVNYVFLQSDAGDYIGLGQDHLYMPPSASITVAGVGRSLEVHVNGPSGWTGHFESMNSIDQLRPGHYGELRRWPFHNPAKGGMDWYGEGRGCNRLSGWFVIDSIAFSNGSLMAVDLRFEQHCEDGAPALRGQVRWRQ